MKTMVKTLPIVHAQPERLDGSGYPDRIAASAIPLAVRIVTVCDVFDALTNDRAYRRALTSERAYEILREGVRDGWWDGEVLCALQAAVAEADRLVARQPPPESSREARRS